MYTRRRFTLIELLVVVAIVTILAALLLPALGQARAKAKNVLCLSNQKQIFLAIQLYADDEDGHMPAPWNIGYHHFISDQWDSHKPMGLASLYRTKYLTDGRLAVCSDNPSYANAYGSGLNEPHKIAYGLDTVAATGSFPVATSSYSLTTTYIVQQATGPALAGAGQGAWEWTKTPDYYYQWGIGSTLASNLPGGVIQHIPNNVSRTIQTPRPLVTCAYTDQYYTYQPHQNQRVNVMYADGVIKPLITTTYPSLRVTTGSWTGKFRDVIHPAYGE